MLSPKITFRQLSACLATVTCFFDSSNLFFDLLLVETLCMHACFILGQSVSLHPSTLPFALVFHVSLAKINQY